MALFALLMGISMVAVGLIIATGLTEPLLGIPQEAALPRYFPGKSSTGEVIDRGIYIVIFSIALGILTEIRYALRTFP